MSLFILDACVAISMLVEEEARRLPVLFSWTSGITSTS